MTGHPKEIITQILYFVPAKSIGRFRSVLKGWLSLLTHPNFIKTHQNTLNKLHLLFVTTESNINHPAVYLNPYDAPVLRPSGLDLLDEANPDYKDIKDLIICGFCDDLVLRMRSLVKCQHEFVESSNVLSTSYCELVVLGGKLALFHEQKGKIWLMNEYRIKESWTKTSPWNSNGYARL
uniref:F-box protein At3g08750-like n=1 Tax=Erigeron canadensis TaxID=72917 RepID=UPI001CB91800|nr:F-box protein At3g08750-like [Erigeron canadensis]